MILVTRIHINGNVTNGAFIVDLYCLGVKEAFWKFNEHLKDFHEFLDKQQRENDYGIRIREADYPLVHNIIYGAIAFAEESGFHPHKSFDLPRHILEEDTDKIELIDIEFGFKGKPLYISRPDNPGEKSRVLPILEKKLGNGNYYFVTEAGADEFFKREEEVEREEIDYQNKKVKKNLILDFVSLTRNPKKLLRRNPEKIVEILEKADIIFFEYMITDEEVDQASAIIGELFDFRISSELLSDHLLFGKMAPPANSREITRQAERLYHMANSDKWKEGFAEVDKMRIQYPEIPVFQYLYLKFIELKTGLGSLLPQLKILSGKDPDYLPYAYMYASALILNKPDKTTRRISDELHLKNFFPGRTSFCGEEVLLYIYLLKLNYGRSGEMAMVEEMLAFMERNHPGLMPEEQLFTAKIGKIPHVLEWCQTWVKLLHLTSDL